MQEWTEWTLQPGENLMILRRQTVESKQRGNTHLYIFLPPGKDVQMLAPYSLDYLTDWFICYCQRVFSGSHWQVESCLHSLMCSSTWLPDIIPSSIGNLVYSIDIWYRNSLKLSLSVLIYVRLHWGGNFELRSIGGSGQKKRVEKPYWLFTTLGMQKKS